MIDSTETLFFSRHSQGVVSGQWSSRKDAHKNGDDRVRTDDPLLAKQVLSQLSYVPSDQCSVIGSNSN